ncbi:hypothetical protein [Mesorhizobium sp. WSM3224]|uniref:hypothetical protein n=1 Tax=Mesorhizobium sp. WSM3224 TaxID=1040986 RepID=UPI00040E4762|nr:hypothetical protein [Mesorhizobium sp. WSM3224]
MMQRKSIGALALGIAIAALSFVQGSGFALAQDKQAATQQQLDRIEQKLDSLIERLGTPGQQSSNRNDSLPATGNDGANKQASAEGGAQGYKRGALAIARVAPAEKAKLSEIPADSVGSFVYSGGAIPLSELSRSGVLYTGLTSVELQGWLKVTEPGRTQLAVEYRATTGSNVFTNPGCIASLWLEDRSIGSQHGEIPMPAKEQKTVSFIFGADLQPGLYKLRAWLACTEPRDLRVLNAQLLIKTPADMNLRMIDSSELLHQGS